MVSAKTRIREKDRSTRWIHPGRHKVSILLDGRETASGIIRSVDDGSSQDVITPLGIVSIQQAGMHVLHVKADEIDMERKIGLTLKRVRLVPVR